MLIVDMPMPKACDECPISNGFKIPCPYGIDDGAGHDMFRAYKVGKRPDWCPIGGELVRCGECRRAIPFSVAGNRDRLCHCDLFDATMARKDFCSYGERKEKTLE